MAKADQRTDYNTVALVTWFKYSALKSVASHIRCVQKSARPGPPGLPWAPGVIAEQTMRLMEGESRCHCLPGTCSDE